MKSVLVFAVFAIIAVAHVSVCENISIAAFYMHPKTVGTFKIFYISLVQKCVKLLNTIKKRRQYNCNIHFVRRCIND